LDEGNDTKSCSAQGVLSSIGAKILLLRPKIAAKPAFFAPFGWCRCRLRFQKPAQAIDFNDSILFSGKH
jgi:hypothetical protein